MKPETMEACLIGGALGDSLGLASEGMNARRIARRWPGPLRQRLIFGHGMVSDDTEHAVMTLLSLMESEHHPQRFAKRLASRLRWWLASIPAGVGLATARSILKLWIGIPASRSGVISAGNGPLMRAPVIGVFSHQDSEARERFVEASTFLTHRDPRALEAAQMIAHAAAMAGEEQKTHSILTALETHIQSAEMRHRFDRLRLGLAGGDTVASFADQIGRKAGYVTGFAPDSAAVAIFAWLRHRGDFPAILEAVVNAGGDTDTIAFIAGSIAGIECGIDKLPRDWMDTLCDWPIRPTLLKRISAGTPVRYPGWPLGIFRNLFFLVVVLCHGFRRLLPPY